MQIILTHENADFDAVASLLAAHKLNPDAIPILPERLNQNVRRFLTLYQNGLPFVQQADFQADTVTSIILVDTQRSIKLRGLPAHVGIHIIDHHPLGRELSSNQTFSGEIVGAATTLLVEQIQTQAIAINGLEATLFALGIYEDTGSLSYGTTTPRDQRAAAWLLEQQASLDTIRQFLLNPLNDDQQMLLDKLTLAAENRTIEGHLVTVCTTRVDQYISEISSVVHRLRDTLDSSVVFVLVQMPEHLQLIGRATSDILNVGDIARLFGGGGHERAAAASIHDKTIDEALALLWQALNLHIQPLARVADLMSYGVQTIEAGQVIGDIVPKLRRIGHEGFPVLDDGKVVGLLTLRDADRTMEHGLEQLKVREVMSRGAIALKPSDSVWTLEQRMVESGWGQIPVLDDSDKLIGIVTRTDLIKHWVRIHPSLSVQPTLIDKQKIGTVLGNPVKTLIQTIAQYAQEKNIPLYLVGGVVRDLLLNRENLDLDFVVEGSAIDFAEHLQRQFGGQVNSFRPFGTAKWKFDDESASKLAIDFEHLPDHIDFATARNEFYEHPTALPTVYNSSIKLDLGRRDFTINTLAIQLSPSAAMGRLLDFFGGENDLKAGLIRVLHSLSYIDDPTRILRAVRFEQRLEFKIEPRTAELIESAKPMLGRITGERLRNELTLLLQEKTPEKGLLNLQLRGILPSIHPAFMLPADIDRQFQESRTVDLSWIGEPLEIADLYWHLIASNILQSNLPGFCERLLFGATQTQTMAAACQLTTEGQQILSEEMKPSTISQYLTPIPAIALVTGWLRIKDQNVREKIKKYWLEWRHIQPLANGNTLRDMGLPPGPRYSAILKRLKEAWLDSEVSNAAEEKTLLQALVNDG
ncbi:MAG: CBS domain-containing protein [Chloroflexota bacterium]